MENFGLSGILSEWSKPASSVLQKVVKWWWRAWNGKVRQWNLLSCLAYLNFNAVMKPWLFVFKFPFYLGSYQLKCWWSSQEVEPLILEDCEFENRLKVITNGFFDLLDQSGFRAQGQNLFFGCFRAFCKLEAADCEINGLNHIGGFERKSSECWLAKPILMLWQFWTKRFRQEKFPTDSFSANSRPISRKASIPKKKLLRVFKQLVL